MYAYSHILFSSCSPFRSCEPAEKESRFGAQQTVGVTLLFFQMAYFIVFAIVITKSIYNYSNYNTAYITAAALTTGVVTTGAVLWVVVIPVGTFCRVWLILVKFVLLTLPCAS